MLLAANNGIEPQLRPGELDDVGAINAIARQYPNELAFVRKNSIIDAINNDGCIVLDLSGTIMGFVLFRRRKDQTSTIYDLAVDRYYTGRGYGRRLLYAVPYPVRLKCKADNDRANRFYARSGMRLIGVEDRPNGTRLYTWYRRVLFIFVAGNNRKHPEIAANAGMAYGSQQFDKARAWPLFMDVEFDPKKANWEDYLTKIERYRPLMAMVVDYDNPDNKEKMLSQIADLRRLDVMRVMVCPKFNGAIHDIPQDCVVALSVPTKSDKFGGWLPPHEDWFALKGRSVHLLGGGPPKQAALADRVSFFGGVVISVDGNSFRKAAQMSVIWNGSKWYRSSSGRWENGDLYETLSVSATNIVRYFNRDSYLTHARRYKDRQMKLPGF